MSYSIVLSSDFVATSIRKCACSSESRHTTTQKCDLDVTGDFKYMTICGREPEGNDTHVADNICIYIVNVANSNKSLVSIDFA
jgi:hypothetical protein